MDVIKKKPKQKKKSAKNEKLGIFSGIQKFNLEHNVKYIKVYKWIKVFKKMREIK